MDEILSVSVVIVTLNRADAIGLLLEELAYQNFDNFEIVVVVGPCSDATLDVLEPFGELIKVVHCDDTNISKSRNIGILHAAGDLVLFIDDDAYPESHHWIADYVEFFRKSENPDRLGIVGGPVLVKNGDSYEFKAGCFDREGFQIFRKENPNQSEDPDRWMTRVAGGNNAASRELLLKMGGYDENIEYYLDETDLCARLIEHDYQVFQSDIAIRHYRLPNRTRKGNVQVNRYLVAKSDFYFTIKHSRLPILLRPFRAWGILPQKHFCKEIFFQGHLNRLNFPQKLLSLTTVLAGGFVGTWQGLFFKPMTRELNSDGEFLKTDKAQLLSLGREYVAFINNEMGEGAREFERESPENHQLQVYWSKDGNFSEKQVETVDYPDGRWCKLSFRFKNTEPFHFLRFDPLRKKGRCSVHSIHLYNEECDRLPFEVGEKQLKEQSGMNLQLGSEVLFQIESTNEDPWMVFQSNEMFREAVYFTVVLKSVTDTHF